VLIQPGNQRVIRVFSVTMGGMLQRTAAYRQLGSGFMSDPGYGDLCAKILRT
jgi:hypothetical protein